ncbi:MAG: hypothetical protein WC437_04990 [Patescibacteria group bacterium]|jgi:hypothetical protein
MKTNIPQLGKDYFIEHQNGYDLIMKMKALADEKGVSLYAFVNGHRYIAKPSF